MNRVTLTLPQPYLAEGIDITTWKKYAVLARARVTEYLALEHLDIRREDAAIKTRYAAEPANVPACVICRTE
jgi:hypothetical protein